MSSTLEAARQSAFERAKSYERRTAEALSKMPQGIDIAGAISGGTSAGGNIFEQFGGVASKRRASYSYFRNWVYSCANVIARRLASQPICAGSLENAPENPQRAISGPQLKQAWLRNKIPSLILQKAVGDQELEVLASHPVLDVLERPNPLQHKFEFVYMWVVNLLLTGEAYWIGGVVDDEEANGVEVWCVPSAWVTPKHEGGLFTSYNVKVSENAQPESVPAENVVRTFFPDPSDIKGCYSPVQACISAIKIDDYIQSGQEAAFERGINPNIVLTVGQNIGPDGKPTGTRPRLWGPQRRQIIRAVKQLWNQSVNLGEPAIIDGLIESIHKLQATPQEMDWQNSGDIVKRRITQTYATNPIVLGEIIGANRAQAVEAQKQLAEQSVNPLADAFSTAATDFFGPIWDEPKRLVVWIENWRPVDPDLELRRWDSARRNGDVSGDEYRTEQLGLPPTGEPERSPLLNTVGGITGAVQLMSAVGMGQMTRESAAKIFELFYKIDEDTAAALVGEGSSSPTAPPEPPPTDPDEPPLPEEPDEDEGEEDNASVRGRRKAEPQPQPSHKLTKAAVKQFIKARNDKSQAALAKALEKYFGDVVRTVAANIGQQSAKPNTSAPDKQAEALLNAAYDEKHWTKELFDAALEPLVKTFAEGALTEMEVMPKKAKAAADDPYDIEDALDILLETGNLPEWLIEAAKVELTTSFAQDYWLKIAETTRDDIKRTVVRGIEDGLSMRDVAKEIVSNHGESYNKYRAMNVARTETTDILNAGHSAGIKQLEEETGVKIGKTWLSIHGPTSRPSHSDMDGEQTDSADGMFVLNGVEIPYPGHYSLDASDRCNCQCSVLSAPIMEELEE